MTITNERPGVGMIPDTEPTTTAIHWTGARDGGWPAVARDLVPALAACAEMHDRDGDFVHEGIAMARTSGLVSMLVPTELGGGGASFADACAVLAELARGCPATSLTLSMHMHLVAAQVWRHHRGLPAPVLARVASEHAVLVSTGAADWLGSGGVVERVEGGYRVSARKSPASGAPAGDLVVTSARFDAAPDGPQVLHFAVPFSAPGVSIDETWNTMGMRATGSHTVVLDDVFVPDAAVSLTRPADVWHPVWATVLGVALPLIMTSYAGVAEAAATRAIALAGRRSPGEDVAMLAGRMQAKLTLVRDTVRAMIDSADDLHFDNTLDHAAVTVARKATAAEAAIETVRVALEVGGGAAYSVGNGIERLYRDVHGALFHPMTAPRQERFCGRLLLGLDPIA